MSDSTETKSAPEEEKVVKDNKDEEKKAKQLANFENFRKFF